MNEVRTRPAYPKPLQDVLEGRVNSNGRVIVRAVAAESYSMDSDRMQFIFAATHSDSDGSDLHMFQIDFSEGCPVANFAAGLRDMADKLEAFETEPA